MLGLAQMSQWRQDALFDPTNPHQKQVVQYAQIPGGYGSWYYSQVPPTGGALMGPSNVALMGPGGVNLMGNGLGIYQIRETSKPAGALAGIGDEWNKLPSMAQAALVLAAGTVAGYFGWKKYGSAISKKVKIPGLSGSRRRR